MMRIAARTALGLIVTLSTSSVASAQLPPPAGPSSRDSLSRPFQALSFDANRHASGSISRPMGQPDLLLMPYGARLPEVTAVPKPHGTPIPCTTRKVTVSPGFKSKMPVVTADKKLDPKALVMVFCDPRD